MSSGGNTTLNFTSGNTVHTRMSISLFSDYKLALISLAVLGIIVLIAYIVLTFIFNTNSGDKKAYTLFRGQDVFDGAGKLKATSNYVPQSVNADSGIEMSISMWVRLDKLDTSIPRNYIFYRGYDDFIYPSTGLFTPCLFFDNTGRVNVDVNTTQDVQTKVGISRDPFPIGRWTLLTVSMTQQFVHVFFNEKRAIELVVDADEMVRFNNGDVIFAPLGGFGGAFGYPTYYNYYVDPNIQRELITRRPRYEQQNLTVSPNAK
jgi:hypothetical protein